VKKTDKKSNYFLDIISTWIKYNEEFYVIPGTEKIITKPFSQWTPQHQNIAQVPSSQLLLLFEENSLKTLNY
jgi:hypothetical protein